MSDEITIALACLLLSAAVALFIFYFREDASDSSPFRTRLDQLLERRDTIYENLRDLNFEYKAGKVPDADYQSMRASLEEEAAAIMAEIGRLEQSVFQQPV